MNMPTRYRRGKLNAYVEAGTIVGPNAFGELLIAQEYDGVSTWFYTTTRDDLLVASRRSPQSMTEFRLLKGNL